ncbi:hypothetical protein LCGC14_2161310 [marine sediment metagenome]|uniref:Uncharacterized protein n=1 Tax=marine sediment metagenome TaxID=412755 RepID=A0A0F9DSU6_9ZZZZ
MFIDMANNLNEYLQDMLVSEGLVGITYTGDPEYVVLKSFITTELYFKSEVK